MTGPTMQEPAPELSVVVPQLTAQERARRASSAFDMVVSGILRPISADLNSLRTQILRDQNALRPDASEQQRRAALNGSIDGFIAANPGSSLTQYLEAGNDPVSSFNWGWAGNRATIRLTLKPAKEVEKWFRDQFSQVRESTVNEIARAAEPTAGSQFNTRYSFLAGMNEFLAPMFSERLIDELTREGSRNALPISIEYKNDLPPADAVLPEGMPRMSTVPYLVVKYKGIKDREGMDM